MTAYYNEINPYVAQWLRNLIATGHIAPGDVDERSIVDVRPSDLAGFTQCHFFAGIGGWSYALRLAGWDDARPVWTGSCPCQPFSIGGTRRGFDDARHLWPVWRGLIAKCRPTIVFGEQVASADGVNWADSVGQDFEAADYAFGTVILPAISVGAPHQRDRFFFAAHPISADAARWDADRWRLQVPRKNARVESCADWNGGRAGYSELDDGLSGSLAKAIAGGFGNAIVPQVAAEFIRAAAR